MNGVFDVLKDEHRSFLRKKPQPDWVTPMLATLTNQPFSNKDWIYEPKFDGERCLVFIRKGSVDMRSRNKKRIGHSYPEIEQAFISQPVKSGIFDGEIVALQKGIPSFARLQRRMHVGDPTRTLLTAVPVYFCVFDVLWLEGFDTTKVPLRGRKRVLQRVLEFKKPLRRVTHRNTKGEDYFEEVCSKPGWEGVIAKRGDGPYVHGRSRDWLKFKCANEQEFVIGGYTDPQGSRERFGALLVGYYDDGDLRYAGKVGTGYDRAMLEQLGKLLDGRGRSTSPFSDQIKEKNVHWVRPDLVAQIGFAEWTPTGRLRHPRFMGLRRDKDARAVVRERPS